MPESQGAPELCKRCLSYPGVPLEKLPIVLRQVKLLGCVKLLEGNHA